MLGIHPVLPISHILVDTHISYLGWYPYLMSWLIPISHILVDTHTSYLGWYPYLSLIAGYPPPATGYPPPPGGPGFTGQSPHVPPHHWLFCPMYVTWSGKGPLRHFSPILSFWAYIADVYVLLLVFCFMFAPVLEVYVLYMFIWMSNRAAGYATIMFGYITHQC